MEVKTDEEVDAAFKICGDITSASTAAEVGAGANDRKCTGGASEDFVLFGARPSSLFDEIALAVDSSLAEEVASLPLLPRTLTESHPPPAAGAGEGAPPKTGEQKILGALRHCYKKNLDVAELFCARNVFTIQHHSKTMRRKILERYLAQENEESDAAEGKGGGKRNNPRPPLPATTFPPPEGELPSPEQIAGMDEEILAARQRLQRAKRRRVQLKCQLDRLARASRPLAGVREALSRRLGTDSHGEGDGAAAPVQTLRETVAAAMEGHHELRGWNARAEEVLRILDKIKVEREEGAAPLAGTAVRRSEDVAGREADERGRRRMWAAVAGDAASYGSKEQIAALLKKLRGE